MVPNKEFVMKLNHFLALFMVLACVSGMGCGSSTSQVASLASNPMISSLTSGLGLTPDQAIGGAGALMNIAKGNLSSDNWKKVSDAVPASGSIMDSGLHKVGLSSDKLKSLADLGSAAGSLGLNMDQVNKMVPAMSDFMSKGGHAEAADLFKGAIK
jgi:hypothetical protein